MKKSPEKIPHTCREGDRRLKVHGSCRVARKR
jgi:hypothetical protein